MNEVLTKRQLIENLNNYPGLIPIAIDREQQQVEWLDFEKYHFYDSFFRLSLDLYTSLKKNSNPVNFFTEVDVLTDENILNDSIYPTGFIFNVGRCGSTLLSKAIARSRENLVFSEAAPHNQIIFHLTDNGKSPLEINSTNQTIYRNLILSMARKRLSTHKHHLIKFTTYNIHFYNFIRSVFPDVPAIFIYRQPREVLASTINKPMVWKTEFKDELAELLSGFSRNGLAQIEFEQKILANLFTSGLNAENIFYLNYKNIKPENLAKILSIFNISPDKKYLELMMKEFNYYSKSRQLKKFQPKIEKYEVSYSNAELESLYNESEGKTKQLSEINHTLY